MKRFDQLEKEAVLNAASIMAAAARTAPKTRGMDNIEIISIDDDASKGRLLEKMAEISRSENRPSFERDARYIGASGTILVIGVRSNPSGLNCGFCGYRTCEDLKKTRGICAFNSVDLGIAAVSAASAANGIHIDNRIMYSIGRACVDLKLFENDVRQALGIPLSVTGKNPFFDRC
jgi:uncharacterized ferredoxin-like protein